MIQMVNVIIEGCLDQTDRLTPCELEFIHSLDESMSMPNETQINKLKLIWDNLRKR